MFIERSPSSNALCKPYCYSYYHALILKLRSLFIIRNLFTSCQIVRTNLTSQQARMPDSYTTGTKRCRSEHRMFTLCSRRNTQSGDKSVGY